MLTAEEDWKGLDILLAQWAGRLFAIFYSICRKSTKMGRNKGKCCKNTAELRGMLTLQM